MRRTVVGCLVVLALAPAVRAGAQNILWGNNAQASGPVTIESFDKTTGARTNMFAGVPGNGRGIVVIGNTVYYTVTNDPVIYMMDATTGAALGGITTSVLSMATIAWDGSQFWTSDYSGTNQAFRINTAGVTTSTINLSNAQYYMDGMEWFNGKLIANRCDGCGDYDIYDLSGNLLAANFIQTGGIGTGIAYDGTNFFVSKLGQDKIGVYDGTTGAFINDIVLTPTHGVPSGFRLIEDLSVDYALRPDTSVPEPATILLFGSGLLGVGLVSMRRRR